MKSWFSRKQQMSEDRAEARFQTIVELVKDLDKKEFNRLKKGMELAWQGYNEVRHAKTSIEKELEDIEGPERILEEVKGGRDRADS